MKNLLLLFLAIFLAGATNAQLIGVKTIKASGGDYATFTEAVNALNSSGVGAGGVTFNVDAGFVSVENCPVITATGTSVSPIVFQKYGTGANPVIKPVYTFTNSAGIAIQGGDYFTFDGIDISTVFDPNGNNTYSFDFGYYIYNASTANGAQYNTIKNCTVTLNRYVITTRGIYQNIAINPTSAAGANSYNTFDNIFIQNSCWGIYFKGHTVNNDLSCVIKNCTIGASTANDIGDCLNSSGIRVTGSAGINVFNNEIRNVTVTGGTLYGLWLENTKGTNNIYNNKIHDLVSATTFTTSFVYGIQITCLASYTTVCNVYNNTVYALQHGATAPTATRLIQAMGMTGTGSTGNFYYNSVRIEEDANPTSTCFYNAAKANLKNNIFANFSAAGATSTRHCIYNGGTLLVSNYNDYYIAAGTNNYVGFSGSAYSSLADWQTGTSMDAQSISSDPLFTSATNLFPTNVALAAGTPIAGITTDIAGATRSATSPSMGAYELPASLTWNGSADSDWNTAANWTPNAIPTSTSDVSIPDVTTNPMVNQPAASPAQCNNITIQAGAVLTINTGKALTVNGTLTNNAGTAGLVVKSSGSLIEHSSGVSTTVERDIVSGADAWHLFISPVAESIQASAASCFNTAYLDRYEESWGAWVRLVDNEYVLPETAYSVNFPIGDHTLVFPGTLKTSPFQYTNLSFTAEAPGYLDGWHLAGNPYPSGLNLALCTLTGGLNAFAYSWNGSNYATYSIGSNDFPGIAPSLGGFFVRTSSGSNNLTLDNAAKTHGGTFLKNDAVIKDMLKLLVNGNGYSDVTFIRFNENATPGFDQDQDAYKLFGIVAAPQLYSLLSRDVASVNSLPSIETNSDVAIGFKAGAENAYTITASGMESFNSSTPLLLEDLQTNTTQDMRQNAIYSFTAAPGDTEHRFNLHFKSANGIGDIIPGKLSIYSSHHTVFVSNLESLQGRLEVYNITGQLLYSASLTGNPTDKIEMGNNTGCFVVKAITVKGISTGKVFVN